MPLLSRWASLWRNLLRSPEVERDLDDELRAYVDLLTEEKLRAGMPAEAARRAARVEAGVEAVKEEVRASWSGAWLGDAGRDLRYAWRGVRRSPAFAFTSVGSVGLAIAAATIVFSWTESMVLRPLPVVPESGRLVRVRLSGPSGGTWWVSYPDYLDWRGAAQSVEGLAVQTTVELAVSVGGPPTRAWGVTTSPNLFEVLRVRPVLGQAFPPDDGSPQPVAVISHRLWRGLFAGDSGIVGRAITVNGHAVTIVGVGPARFVGAEPGVGVDLWIPTRHYELLSCRQGTLTDRGMRIFAGIARLRPGVGVDSARRDLDALHQRSARVEPASRGSTVVVAAIQGWGAGPRRLGVCAALLAATLLVVLVACANVANLLLARAAARRREIGIRLAVGAGRARLARQWLVESAVLALGGGGLGLVLAAFGKQLILSAPPSDVPSGYAMAFDGRVVAFAAALTAAAALLVGLVPAWAASRMDPTPVMQGGATEGRRHRMRIEAAMIVVQVALSVVCLVFAGLFLRGARRALAADTGMRTPAEVLVFNQRLYVAGYTCATAPAFIERMRARLLAEPGVRVASVATFVPLGASPPMAVPGLRFERGSGAYVEPRGVQFSAVGPDYFEALGTPIVRGRSITREDGPATPPVAVVNEAFARRFWPGADPLGLQFELGGQRVRVVGVARDAPTTRLTGPTPPFLFISLSQFYYPEIAFVVRADGDANRLRERLGRAFAEVEPRLPPLEGRTLLEHVGAASWGERFGAWTLSTAAALALFLCAVGVYGTLAYTVAQRTREIGVRLAIGAGVRDVVGLVVGGTMRLTAIGLALGVGLAVVGERLLRRWMLGVGAPDAAVVSGVVLLLGVVALLAAWLPARRATRVDPAIALEAE